MKKNYGNLGQLKCLFTNAVLPTVFLIVQHIDYTNN